MYVPDVRFDGGVRQDQCGLLDLRTREVGKGKREEKTSGRLFSLFSSLVDVTFRRQAIIFRSVGVYNAGL
jgi:hypothetical protein